MEVSNTEFKNEQTCQVLLEAEKKTQHLQLESSNDHSSESPTETQPNQNMTSPDQPTQQMVDQILSMMSNDDPGMSFRKKNSWRQSAIVTDRKSSIEMGTKKNIVSSLRSFFLEELSDFDYFAENKIQNGQSDQSDDDSYHNTNNVVSDNENSPEIFTKTPKTDLKSPSESQFKAYEANENKHQIQNKMIESASALQLPPEYSPTSHLKVEKLLGTKEITGTPPTALPGVIPVGFALNPLQSNGGWLMKRGAIRKNWKKRWFYIRRNRLYYSTSPTAEYINFIRIDHETKVVADTHRNENGFLIQTVDRDYVLYASTSQEQQQWMQAVNELIEVQIQKQLSKTPVLPTGWAAKPLVDLILIEATNLLESESYYCLIKCDNSPWCKTRTIKGDMPIWNEDYTFLINSDTSSVMIDLYVCGTLNDKLISSYVLPISEFSSKSQSQSSSSSSSSSPPPPSSSSSSSSSLSSLSFTRLVDTTRASLSGNKATTTIPTTSDEGGGGGGGGGGGTDEAVYEGWVSAQSLYPLTSNLYSRPSTLLSPREDHFNPKAVNSLSQNLFITITTIIIVVVIVIIIVVVIIIINVLTVVDLIVNHIIFVSTIFITFVRSRKSINTIMSSSIRPIN